MPRCKTCGKNGKKELMQGSPATKRMSCKTPECMAPFGLWLLEEKRKRDKEAYNKRTRELKEKIEGRLDLYDKLGHLVNQYVKQVHQKGKPCYTCGKQQRFEDKPQAFHAGHCWAAKRVDPRRFMIEHIRMQCYSCNTANSGRPDVFKAKLMLEMGQEWFDWFSLDASHKPLQEQYKTLDCIREEIQRFRKMLRDNGVTPRR